MSAGALATQLNAAGAEPGASNFNEFIANAVIHISKPKVQGGRAGGGYGGPGAKNMSYAFTDNLTYGSSTVPQSPATAKRDPDFIHATMCVAAVGEILIEAINFYAASEKRKVDPYDKLDVKHWNTSAITSLRSYLWMQVDNRNIWHYASGQVPRSNQNGRVVSALSRGSAHSFSIFRMGEELPFSKLMRGDFINLNRTNGGGHSTIFWGYIDPNTESGYTQTWSKDVIGFTYFSAQGPRTAAAGGGFAFRDAYFGAAKLPPAKQRNHNDPGVILKQTSQLYLNSGRLWLPDQWDAKGAVEDIKKRVRASTAGLADRDATSAARLNEVPGDTFVQFTTGDEEQ
jgi:hypothetical protein